MNFPLSHGELDLVILANIQKFTMIDVIGEKRKRSAGCNFLYLNRPICKEMFLNTYGISYEEHGIYLTTHCHKP